MNFYVPGLGIHYDGHTGVLRWGRVFKSRTRKQRAARRAERRKESADGRQRVGSPVRKGVSGAAQRGHGITLTDEGWVDSADLTPEARARAHGEHRKRAGQCGQPTADGTPCRRRGQCAPGAHTRKTTTGRK